MRTGRVVGLALAALGMLAGAGTLAYPFGRDQGLFFYVAREFLRSGAVLYKDVYDHKTPGIYVLHVALMAVLGENMWAIRAAEWVAIAGLGLVSARLATPPSTRTPPELYGLGVLLANVSYFGFFNFWDSAQCELWCAVATTAALALTLRTHTRRTATDATAGVLAAIAVLMKLPCAPMAAVVFAVVVGRARHEGRLAMRRSALVFSAGFLVVMGATVAWFAAHGALDNARDVLVGANGDYVRNDTDVHDLREAVAAYELARAHFDPLVSVLHVALVATLASAAIRRRLRSALARHALPVALIVAGAAGVFAQRKFFLYHFGLVLSGELLLALTLAADALAFLQRRTRFAWAAPFAFAAAVAALFACSDSAFSEWLGGARATFAYATGRWPRDRFTREFRVESLHYYYHDSEEVADYLRARAEPGDRVLVRAFQPEIYARSGLSYGGRFFWDTFITNPRRLYRRDDYLAWDLDDIQRVKPRFVVAIRPRTDMEGWPTSAFEIQTPEWFERFGYRPVRTMYQYVVMERDP